MRVVSRKEAKEKGLLRYFTGVPCKAGHVAERTTSSCICLECQATRRANNLAAERVYQNKWYHKNKKEISGRQRARYLQNLESQRLRSKAKYAANKEAIRAKSKERYIRSDKEKYRVYCRNRHAAKIAAPGRHTKQDIKRIGMSQGWKCYWCGISCEEKYHVDHLIPLSRGGSNWPDNLCISCPRCNHSKHTKTPEEFLRYMAGVL